jgi:hypothetical protein
MPTNTENLGTGSSLRHILNWFQNHYRWPLLLPLLLVSLGVGVLSSQNFMGWERDGYVLKPHLEIAHPALLCLFILVSVYGWLGKGFKVSGWMAFLGTALLIREIHFVGSDYLMFAMLIGLLVYAWRNPSRFTPLWEARWPLSFLVTCFMYYACSEALFDRALIENPSNSHCAIPIGRSLIYRILRKVRRRWAACFS